MSMVEEKQVYYIVYGQMTSIQIYLINQPVASYRKDIVLIIDFYPRKYIICRTNIISRKTQDSIATNPRSIAKT